MNSDKVKPSAFIVQALSALAIAYLNATVGFVYAWPSFTVANFKSNETVLSHPMSSYEVSLLGSLTNIGGLIATPLCGYATTKIGRKYTSMLFGLPLVLTWTIISVTNYVPLVIAAMGLAGFGGAGQMVTTIYITEIAQDSIRGGLSAATVYEYFIGILFSYTIGGYFTYKQVVYTHLALSLLYLFLLTLIYDSPVYLVQAGREKDAAKSLAFYRRESVSSKEVQMQINKIKLLLDPAVEKMLKEDKDIEATHGLVSKNIPQEKISAWKFLVRSESSMRALGTVLLLVILTVFMGSVVLQVYAEPLFQEAVPSMSSNLCAILLAASFFIGCLICASIVDKFGRKPLLMVTSTIAGICWLLLGTQLQFHWSSHWLTVVLIYGFSFTYNMGGAAIPFIITSEIFLPEVRELCNTIFMCCMWVMTFVTLVVFNLLTDYFGLKTVFYAFGTSSLINVVYVYKILPETKGLPVDKIQLLFLKKRNK